ncbi:hypothetical protein [Rubinisphaera margarita]|uniref:hypothetical protein n=1 Tax=Rubinisphaera margarita TaxID=2909586 RepID=UPI001EE7EBAF|nr:hypothetical protein [Rubinisphaera margarita]MCG6157582.1 hypothetical protein [Rubinisphaera margarita]
MNAQKPAKWRFLTRLLGILLGLAVLVALCDAFFPFFLRSGVVFSGYRWTVYPTGNSVDDSSSAQEGLAYDGNIKVLSLIYYEQLASVDREQVGEAYCHVLLDLPPEGVLRITGGGGSDVANFDNYKKANLLLPGDDGESPLKIEVRVRVRFSDGQVVVNVGDQTAQITVASGNVLTVRIGADGRILESDRFVEHIPHELSSEDVARIVVTNE